MLQSLSSEMVTKIRHRALNLRVVSAVLKRILFVRNVTETIRVSVGLAVMYVLNVASQAIELEIVLSQVLRVNTIISPLNP